MRISRCFQNVHKLKQEKTEVMNRSWRFSGSLEKLVMSKLSFSAAVQYCTFFYSASPQWNKPVVVLKRTSDEQEVHNSDKDLARDRSLLQLALFYIALTYPI